MRNLFVKEQCGICASNHQYNANNASLIPSHLEQCNKRKHQRWALAIMKSKLAFPGQFPSITPTPIFPQLVFFNEIQYFPKKFMGFMELDQICTTSGTHQTSETSESHRQCDKHSGDFYACLRPILILGRILGIIPITGIFHSIDDGNDKSLIILNFGWKSIPVLYSLIVLLILGTNTVLSFVNLLQLFAEGRSGNASQLALAARNPMFYLVSFLIYLFFLSRAKALIKLFFKWRIVTRDLGFKEKDTKLSKHFFLYSAVIFGFGIFENVLYTVNNFPVSIRGANQTAFEAQFSPLETYYWRSHLSWATFLSYNSLITVALLTSNILASYARNYADLFLVLCSRALYYKFVLLVDQTSQKLCGPSTSKKWSHVRKDHLTLCTLLDEFELFLSPLIFLSYSANIFFICLEIHQGLTPQDSSSYLTSAFSFSSFLHLLLRVLAVSITVAKINEYAHQITTSIQRCDTNEYCSELERLERMLAAEPIGLTGLGCFVVTRAFLLMVVSVVFTVEIVLLQASATPQAGHQIQQGFNASTEMSTVEF